MNINHNRYINYTFKRFNSLFVQSVKVAYTEVNFSFNFNFNNIPKNPYTIQWI